MIDWNQILNTRSALLLVLGMAGVLLLLLLHKVMSSNDNNLDWWQFISTRGQDGKNYADIDKLGKVAGIFISSWYVISTGSKPDASVLAVYLAYVGGVAGYSAYLRSQRGMVTESSHTETTSTSVGKSSTVEKEKVSAPTGEDSIERARRGQ